MFAMPEKKFCKAAICSKLFLAAFIAAFISPVYSQGLKWFKGNIHAHTVNSDGSSSPDVVIRWYKEHHYNFCVISDHNFFTDPAGLKQVFDASDKFMIFPAEEVTDRYETKPVHLGAVFISKLIVPQHGHSVSETIDNNAISIRDAGGIAILNHPNGLLRESISALAIGQTSHTNFFEVCCADFKGGSMKPSTDQIWDSVLSQGKLLYGTAADDAHIFDPVGNQAGTAWIMVQAGQLTMTAIADAMKRGDFYATTGVELKTLTIDDKQIKFTLDAKDWGFKSFFIGDQGKILKTDESASPSYTFSGNEKYVRVRIERSDGAYAWLQPKFIK